jgi:soluble lytic murein transglycosylase-like protein
VDVAAIVYAVEQVESGGAWYVENGGCVGVMQINPKWSICTRAELLDPTVNRVEGERLLKVWLTRAHDNWHRALAGYNCGNAGLRGECGQRYARKVWRLAKQYQETERKLHGWLAWIAKPEA